MQENPFILDLPMKRRSRLNRTASWGIAFLVLLTADVRAQWVAGVGYQWRAISPPSGVAVHVERHVEVEPWLYGFARGQATYLFKRTTYAPGFGTEVPGGWIRGYDAAVSVGAGFAWEPAGLYAGVGGGYERTIHERTAEGLTDPRYAATFPRTDFPRTERGGTGRHLVRYVGVTLHPFNRVLLYGERLWPWHTERTLPAYIPHGRTAVGVGVRF